MPVMSYAAVEVRRHDRDRFLTALFAPSARRDDLLALYAFNLEVARVRETVREPMLGRIRLQWWRDGLETIHGGGTHPHPVAEPLAEAIRRHGLTPDALGRLIDAREHDLDDTPVQTLPQLEAYAEATSATLSVLSLQVLDATGAATAEAARHVGIAWALTGLLRAAPFHAAAGRLYLPRDLLHVQGVDPDDVLAGRGSDGLNRVVEGVAGRARWHLAQARANRRAIDKKALPALLPGALADTYLQVLRRLGYNPFAPAWSLARPAAGRLTLRAWCGRY